jgi:hypothetical protein
LSLSLWVSPALSFSLALSLELELALLLSWVLSVSPPFCLTEASNGAGMAFSFPSFCR